MKKLKAARLFLPLVLSLGITTHIGNAFALSCPSVQDVRAIGTEFSYVLENGFELGNPWWIVAAQPFAWNDLEWQTIYKVYLDVRVRTETEALKQAKEIIKTKALLASPSGNTDSANKKCFYTYTNEPSEVKVIAPPLVG